jgi:hypothetical protein
MYLFAGEGSERAPVPSADYGRQRQTRSIPVNLRGHRPTAGPEMYSRNLDLQSRFTDNQQA